VYWAVCVFTNLASDENASGVRAPVKVSAVTSTGRLELLEELLLIFKMLLIKPFSLINDFLACRWLKVVCSPK